MNKLKKILLLLFAFTTLFTNSDSVFAAEQILQINNIEIASKSDTVAIDGIHFDGETLSNNISFAKEGDELQLDLNIQNISEETFVISSIENNLESNNLAISYEYPEEALAPEQSAAIRLKLTYARQAINVEKITLSDVQITIRLTNIEYLNQPNAQTVDQALVLKSTPNTSDNILIYSIIFVILAVAFIILIYKARKNKKLLALVIAMNVLLISFTAYAIDHASKTLGFSSIDLIGIFETYEISFNSGSDTPTTTREVEYGQKLGDLPTAPNKNGYEFVEWQNTDGEKITGNETITGPITINAVYRIIEYPINYDLQDGKLTAANPSSYNIESNSFTLNNPNLDNYNFEGWTSNTITTPSKSVTIEKGSYGELNFTANYTPKLYDVTFDANGGEIDENERTKQVAYKTAIGNMPTPTITGDLVFDGWFDTDAEEGATKITEETIVYGSTTYYAHWKEAGPKITEHLAQMAKDENNIVWSRGAQISDSAYTLNGNGLNTYKENGADITYYRGEIYDNNLIWANQCWKIFRTTYTGGTKIMYNGTPTEVNVDGETVLQCLAEGKDVLLPTEDENNYVNFNNDPEGCDSGGTCTPAYSGYMYGDIVSAYSMSMSSTTMRNNEYIFSDSVSRNGNNYVLNTEEGHSITGKWADMRQEVGKKYQYFCTNKANSCNNAQIAFVTGADSDYTIKILRIGGYDNIEQALAKMQENTHDSTVKKVVDKWYEDNLLSYANDLEDTPFCSERTFDSGILSLSPDNTRIGSNIYTASQRINNYYQANQPTLDCVNKNDTFTVSPETGNGALKYKIGLITADEAILIGQANGVVPAKHYLKTEADTWTMTPDSIRGSAIYHFYTGSEGTRTTTVKDTNYPTEVGARPVVSLKAGIRIKSGNGLNTNPYIVE